MIKLDFSERFVCFDYLFIFETKYKHIRTYGFHAAKKQNPDGVTVQDHVVSSALSPSIYQSTAKQTALTTGHSSYAEHVILLEHFGSKQLGSDAFIAGPGRYRKVGEKKRNNSVQFAGRTLRSDDQTTKK